MTKTEVLFFLEKIPAALKPGQSVQSQFFKLLSLYTDGVIS